MYIVVATLRNTRTHIHKWWKSQFQWSH